MTAESSAEPCCLPNEILSNTAGISWTIESAHHVDCPNTPTPRQENN
ncbi:hypothetical protein [Arthrobacter sp. UYEF36]